jgi:hypothetical protein
VPYQKSDGTYVYTQVVPGLGSAARTTSAAGPAVEVGDHVEVRDLKLAVTAVAGTSPTLDVTVKTSPDAATWTNVGTFAQKTGAATETKTFFGLDRYLQVSWVIGGTGSPSVTFDVSGGELV